jgi:hypothetical protein
LGELRARFFANQGLGECARNGENIGRRLVSKFQTEVANPSGAPIVKPSAGFLRLCAEHGIAATDIGDEGMRAAIHVAQ